MRLDVCILAGGRGSDCVSNEGVKHIHCILKPIVEMDTGDAISRAAWSPLPIKMEDSTIVFLCVVFGAIFAVIGIAITLCLWWLRESDPEPDSRPARSRPPVLRDNLYVSSIFGTGDPAFWEVQILRDSTIIMEEDMTCK